MDKWENIIKKKEAVSMSEEEFRDKYPEFFQLVGKEIIGSVMRGSATGIMDKEKDAIILRQERFAWANALSKLRPFLKSFNITDEGIDALVHKFTLGSYCNQMSKDYED